MSTKNGSKVQTSAQRCENFQFLAFAKLVRFTVKRFRQKSSKMPGVTKKTKQKVAKKATPEKVQKKFISESVSFTFKFSIETNCLEKARFLINSCKTKSRKKDLRRKKQHHIDVVVVLFISNICLMDSTKINCGDTSRNLAPSHVCDWLDRRKHSAQKAMLSSNFVTQKSPKLLLMR